MKSHSVFLLQEMLPSTCSFCGMYHKFFRRLDQGFLGLVLRQWGTHIYFGIGSCPLAAVCDERMVHRRRLVLRCVCAWVHASVGACARACVRACMHALIRACVRACARVSMLLHQQISIAASADEVPCGTTSRNWAGWAHIGSKRFVPPITQPPLRITTITRLFDIYNRRYSPIRYS